MERYPFSFNPTKPFIPQLGEWMGDLFYDTLPQAGFEVREEQIYMAFQLERAYAEKRTIFAEAGVGTGKTIVYLLYAIFYARFTGRPAVIACADESLIEQLVKPEGDIAKLSKHLNLIIDTRLGKSPDQYLCLNRLEEAVFNEEFSTTYREIQSGLPAFVHSREALQAFYPYGDRKQYPHLDDLQWSRIEWNSFQDCFSCTQRHRCGQTLSRDYYRKATDLIICSHDYYMEHLWTMDSRKREGQLPLLPAHSSVVFDEGHLLEAAAQKGMTYKLNHSVFVELTSRIVKGRIRQSLLNAVDESITRSELLFSKLRQYTSSVAGSERRDVHFHEDLMAAASRFKQQMDVLEEELTLESGLFTINPYQLLIVEEHFDVIQMSLGLFLQSEQAISWVTEEKSELTLVIMPRMVNDVLKERLFSQTMPIVFSSATLSISDSFQFLADSIGIETFISFAVPSPFDFVQQMKVTAPKLPAAALFSEEVSTAAQLIKSTEGRALVLFTSKEEMHRFKDELPHHLEGNEWPILFEGEQEINHLISTFQQDEHSVLCSFTLWEGLDIPGPSLSQVMIWSLPFPPEDPLYNAKRKYAEQPYDEVDLPHMLLRLRQGIGRLIRTRDDTGIISIMDQRFHTNEKVRAHVEKVLPVPFVYN